MNCTYPLTDASIFDYLVNCSGSYLSNPFVVSAIPIIFVSLFYFYGKLLISNDCLLNLSDKKNTSLLFGLQFFNNYFFNPIIILFALYFFKEILLPVGSLLILGFFFLERVFRKVKTLRILIMLGFLIGLAYYSDAVLSSIGTLLLILFIVSSTIFKIINYMKNIAHKGITKDVELNVSGEGVWYELASMSLQLIPYALYLLSYLILINTSKMSILLIVIYVNLMSLSFIAYGDRLKHRKKKINMVVNGKLLKDVTPIEFLDENQLIKYAHKNKVKIIPFSKVDELILPNTREMGVVESMTYLINNLTKEIRDLIPKK